MLSVTGNAPPLSDVDSDTGGGAPGGWLAGAPGLLLLLWRLRRRASVSGEEHARKG
jgi:hypothetical protein